MSYFLNFIYFCVKIKKQIILFYSHGKFYQNLTFLMKMKKMKKKNVPTFFKSEILSFLRENNSEIYSNLVVQTVINISFSFIKSHTKSLFG